jgi:hypothetical protein
MGARSVGPKQRLSRFWNICAQKKVFLSFPWVQVICDYVKIWSSSSHIKVHQQISFCHFGNLQSSWENQILLWHDQGLKFWSIYQNSTDWIGSKFAILTSFCWFHPNREIKSYSTIQTDRSEFWDLIFELWDTTLERSSCPGHEAPPFPHCSSSSVPRLTSESAGRATASPSTGHGAIFVGGAPTGTVIIGHNFPRTLLAFNNRTAVGQERTIKNRWFSIGQWLIRRAASSCRFSWGNRDDLPRSSEWDYTVTYGVDC